MKIIELYDYLLKNGILKEPDVNELSPYDYQVFKQFKVMLYSIDDKLNDLKSNVEFLETKINSLENYDV